MQAPDMSFQFAVADPPVAPKGIEIDGKDVAFNDFLAANKTVAFLIIRNDTLLYENYFAGYDSASIVPSFSMAKSITSLLIGCAIDDGYILSENEPVTRYLPEMAKNGFDKVTIKHLLQMTAGIDFNESYVNPFGDAAAFYYGRKLRKKTLNTELEYEPGAKFEYTSGTTQILGMVLEASLPEGTTVTRYLEEKIWIPLEMEFDAGWSIDRKKDGMEKTFCCINARARDYAKIGRLMLHKGNWNGRQIVSADWVAKSTTVDTTEGSVWYYQYQWWLPTRSGDFLATGILGQYIYVDPSSNMVIVRLGKKPGNVSWSALFPDLAKSYKSNFAM